MKNIKRVCAVTFAAILLLTGLCGCLKGLTSGKTLLDAKRISSASLKDNGIESFSVAYLDEEGNYITDKVFSFTEKNGITFRRALIQNGYFYVNTSIVGKDDRQADATIKFNNSVTGDKFYEKLGEGKESIEKINDSTFYECDTSNKDFTVYYAYKLIKNNATKESKASESEYSKYARYVVVEIKMYIFEDYKTTVYVDYSEDDYKAEVLKIADCITADNKSPYICDLSCVISFNGVSCKDYKLIKEISDMYVLVKYNDLISLRIGTSNTDPEENSVTPEEYLEAILSTETNQKIEIFGMAAAASDRLIELPLKDGKVTTFDIYNLAAEDDVKIEEIVSFINDNMQYKK